MIVCPPKKIAGVPNKQWTDLVDAIGEGEAHLAFIRNGYEIPDVDTANKLLNGEIEVKSPVKKTILSTPSNIAYFQIKDSKVEAERQRNVHNTLKTLAGIYKEAGSKDAQEFADELGLRLVDVERAWKETNEGIITNDDNLKLNPYDIDIIREALSKQSQQIQMIQLESDGKAAIANGATNLEEFNKYMTGNPSFDALPDSSKEILYYNSVSIFATSQAITQEQDAPNIINLKEQSWLQKIIETFQNKMTRVKDVQEQMEAVGIKILQEANVALKFELLVGKTINIIEEKQKEIFDKNNKNSLFNRLKIEGGDVDELGMYMYALHAEERNASNENTRQEEFNKQVEALNQKIKDAKSQSLKTRFQNELNRLVSNQGKAKLLQGAGSGMTNQQAQEIIDAVEQSGKKDLYDKYAKEFREKVIEPTLDAQLKYGLITQEIYDVLKTNYKNYVPLQVVEKSLEKKLGAGIKGASVKGKDIYKAKGSDLYKYTDRYNPVFSSMFAFENAIIRGERNQASQSLIKLAELDTQKEILEVHSPDYTPITDSNNDISYLFPTTPQNLKDRSIELKVNGKPIFVEIKDTPLRKALQEQGIMRGVRGLYIINNWLRSTATLMNPDFIFTNFARDFQTALVNIQSDIKDLNIKNITKQIANPKNIYSAGKGIVADSKGDYTSEWGRLAKEYRDNGGKVSWFQRDNLEEYVEDLRKEIAKINKGENLPLRTLNRLGNTLLLAQSVVEQSIRLNTYKALRDAGVSKEQAASAAKNITVNFENKGTWSGFIDSLYLFATAGLSGTVRMANALSKSKVARTIAGSIFAYGILEAASNDMLGGDDNDDENIKDGIKERNFVLVNPTDSKKEPILFPMPYGLNVFKYSGNLVYDVAKGRKSGIDATSKMFMSIYGQISPFQGATMLQAAAPTILDPIAQNVENKNFLGKNIKPDQPKFLPSKKESDLYFSSVRPTSLWVSKKLNEWTGGSAAEKGKIDISPEVLDHYYDAIGGGTGKFMSNVAATAVASSKKVVSMIHGEEMNDEDKIPMRRLPFIKVFFGSKPEKDQLEFIYKTFERSATEEISDEDMKRFIKEVNQAIVSRAIDPDDGKKFIKTVREGQFKINRYKGVQELMPQDMTEKERIKFFQRKK